ncbi:dephospho-CoA kinase [Flavihumibacter sp. CACIAM 22H1]|uniref:dephospho-CoA kinase n=1 Tax=Flavihumibacter sp. CACIAM 22H1 TaxID=1812911 RepID=UPI0007A90E71|nr:dephospho-CoA kinase [Flavihumibacter sp. CACIAM 22H1]KYP14908.1 MAG: dephospho-CoA kinase [Flavihumibacter sp. CACIAM 22H1]
MLKIGITGGIGSGKSIVSRAFEHLGIPVYNADTAAKRLMQEDPALRAQISALLGPETYQNGQLNRSFISSIVFKDRKKLDALNALVHPATIQYGKDWMRRQNAPYALKEAALIFESGSQDELDYVIGVSAPTALRIHRVMQRDQVSREQVLQRMLSQLDESLKMKLCDFVIVNDDQQLVLPQVLALHARFIG